MSCQQLSEGRKEEEDRGEQKRGKRKENFLKGGPFVVELSLSQPCDKQLQLGEFYFLISNLLATVVLLHYITFHLLWASR